MFPVKLNIYKKLKVIKNLALLIEKSLGFKAMFKDRTQNLCFIGRLH